MKLHHFVLAASLLALPAACATGAGNGAALQETAGLMVSIEQHGEGIDVAESAAQLDAQIAAAPSDPYVLKLAAMARTSLAANAQDRATRVKLRQEALDQFDRAISLTRQDTPARTVRLNGQETEIDLKDVPDLRAQLFQTIQTDR